MRIAATVAALAGTLFLAPFLAGGFGIIGPSILQILVGLGGAAFVLRSKQKPAFPAAAWGLAVLIAFALASMPTSESLYQSLRHLLLLVSYLLVFLLAANVRGFGWRATTPALVLASAGFVLAALGIREFTTGPGTGWRVFATFANPNYFSGFLVMSLPVTLALYLSAKERSHAMVLAVAVVLQFAALVLTAARFGIAAGTLGVTVFLGLALVSRSLDKVSGKRLLIAAALAVPLLIIAARPVAQRVGSEATAQAHSGNFRVYTWKATVNMALANPTLGTGAGTFEIAFPRYNIAGYTRSAHQTFLQSASEMGLAAPVALFFSLAAVAWTLGHGLRRRGEDDPAGSDNDTIQNGLDTRVRALLLAGLFGGLLASSTRNMIDSDWYVPALGLTFWLLAGWGYALATRDREVSSPGGAGRIAVGAMSLALAVFAAQMLIGGLYARAAERAIARYDLQDGIVAYRTAIKFMPLAADYHLGLGKLQAAGTEDPTPVLETLRRAERLEPTRARYPYVIGMVLAGRGRSEEAVRELERAARLDPHAPRVRLALGDAYESVGEQEEALEIYREMVRAEESVYERVKGVPELVEPAYAYARYRLAADAERRELFDEAITHLEAAVERLERRRNHAQIIQAAQIGGAASPEDEPGLHELLISSHLKLGELYMQSGDREKSESHRKRAEQLEKQGPLGQANEP
jgi:tetratricopeptide (TPR) repeat protein/O-antigen ligase